MIMEWGYNIITMTGHIWVCWFLTTPQTKKIMKRPAKAGPRNGAAPLRKVTAVTTKKSLPVGAMSRHSPRHQVAANVSSASSVPSNVQITPILVNWLALRQTTWFIRLRRSALFTDGRLRATNSLPRPRPSGWGTNWAGTTGAHRSQKLARTICSANADWLKPEW